MLLILKYKIMAFLNKINQNFLIWNIIVSSERIKWIVLWRVKFDLRIFVIFYILLSLLILFPFNFSELFCINSFMCIYVLRHLILNLRFYYKYSFIYPCFSFRWNWFYIFLIQLLSIVILYWFSMVNLSITISIYN